MDIDYPRLAVTIILGAVLYYAMMVLYTQGAANVITLAYVLVLIPVYQKVGQLQRIISTSVA